MPPPQEALSSTATYLSEHAAELVVAVVVLIVSFRVINYLVQLLHKALTYKNVDPKLTKPIVLGSKYLAYLVLIAVIGSFLGMNTTSILVIIIAIVLFIVVAMQATLANIGGGVMLLAIKPFHKGNFVNINNQEGYVQDISLYHTHLRVRNNSVVLIPNAKVLNADIINMEKRRNRRVSIDIFVSADSDTKKLIQAAKNATKGDKRILTEPNSRFFVKQIYPFGIKMRTNLWVKKADYWDVWYDYNQKILEAYKGQHATFPNIPVSYTSEDMRKANTTSTQNSKAV